MRVPFGGRRLDDLLARQLQEDVPERVPQGRRQLRDLRVRQPALVGTTGRRQLRRAAELQHVLRRRVREARERMQRLSVRSQGHPVRRAPPPPFTAGSGCASPVAGGFVAVRLRRRRSGAGPGAMPEAKLQEVLPERVH